MHTVTEVQILDVTSGVEFCGVGENFGIEHGGEGRDIGVRFRRNVPGSLVTAGNRSFTRTVANLERMVWIETYGFVGIMPHGFDIVVQSRLARLRHGFRPAQQFIDGKTYEL